LIGVPVGVAFYISLALFIISNGVYVFAGYFRKKTDTTDDAEGTENIIDRRKDNRKNWV